MASSCDLTCSSSSTGYTSAKSKPLQVCDDEVEITYILSRFVSSFIDRAECVRLVHKLVDKIQNASMEWVHRFMSLQGDIVVRKLIGELETDKDKLNTDHEEIVAFSEGLVVCYAHLAERIRYYKRNESYGWSSTRTALRSVYT